MHDFPDRILSQDEVIKMVSYSEPHLRRLEKDQKFPRRLQLGPRKVGWRLSDVMAWIAARPAKPLHRVAA